MIQSNRQQEAIKDGENISFGFIITISCLFPQILGITQGWNIYLIAISIITTPIVAIFAFLLWHMLGDYYILMNEKIRIKNILKNNNPSIESFIEGYLSTLSFPEDKMEESLLFQITPNKKAILNTCLNRKNLLTRKDSYLLGSIIYEKMTKKFGADDLDYIIQTNWYFSVKILKLSSHETMARLKGKNVKGIP
jgi:hypothetical protein